VLVSKGAETRDAILERALHLASQVGLGGLSIGRLADDLDLSKSGLFAHFQSKEALQLQTLERAAEKFTNFVIRPALQAPRGVARLRAFFDQWIRWPQLGSQPGGCIFAAASVELDDQPGATRDLLVRLQRDLLATIATIVRGAVDQGELRKDVDPEQFAFELYGIQASCHHASRLLGDEKAADRARGAFDRLVESARAPSR
jgi:AcrR family transcriptional regulator